MENSSISVLPTALIFSARFRHLWFSGIRFSFQAVCWDYKIPSILLANNVQASRF
jgi:hypothetical protein